MATNHAKTSAGIAFTRDKVYFLALRGQALVFHQVVEATPAQVADPEKRRALAQAAGQLLAQAHPQRKQVYLSIPSREGALHQVPRPGKRGGLFFPEPEPPLEQLTPLAPEKVCYDLRPLPRRAGGQEARLAQVALVRRELVESIRELVSAAGLRPRALDLELGYLARDGLELAGEDSQGLFMFLDQFGAQWCHLDRGRPGMVDQVPRLAGEEPTRLMLRAVQQAVQVAGLEGPLEIHLAGPLATQAAGGYQPPEQADPASLDLNLRPLPQRFAPPQGLDWPAWPLYFFLHSLAGSEKPLFNLLPASQKNGWLSSRRTTRRLAWAAAGLAALIVLQAGVTTWWARHRAEGRIDQAQAQLARLKEEGRKLNLRARSLAPLDQAVRSRRELPGLMTEIARYLPPRAWVERLEYDGHSCTLYLAGLDQKRAAGLFPSKGRLRLAGPVKRVTAPGSGRPALKLVLLLGTEKTSPKRRPAARSGKLRP